MVEKRRYHYAALGYKEVRYLLKSEVDDLNDIAVNGLVTKQWSEERKIIMSEKTKVWSSSFFEVICYYSYLICLVGSGMSAVA